MSIKSVRASDSISRPCARYKRLYSIVQYVTGVPQNLILSYLALSIYKLYNTVCARVTKSHIQKLVFIYQRSRATKTICTSDGCYFLDIGAIMSLRLNTNSCFLRITFLQSSKQLTYVQCSFVTYK